MRTHIELEEAVSLIVDQIAPLGVETGRLFDVGRTLAEDLTAPLDQPPFDRSPLDGYALQAADLALASRTHPAQLTLVDTRYAGDVAHIPVEQGQAVRIMTGAMLPPGCDCVVRQEDTDRGETKISVYTPLKPDENYIHRGEDFTAGTVLLPAGTRLDAAAIGVLASAGLDTYSIRRRPSVGVIATGDEVVYPHVHPLPPGKIYGSNGALLVARLTELGISSLGSEQVGDDPRAVADAIRRFQNAFDLVITTGGVSEGAKDILHEALPLLGAEQVFWKINAKPGSPALFSRVGHKPVLCLSGNPFAAAATFELLGRPILAALSGEPHFLPRRVPAVLETGFGKFGKMRRYLRGSYENGRVKLPGKNASGLLSSAVGCNCLVEIPPSDRPLNAGEPVDVLLL